jgi:hypothetical protein
MQQVLVAVVLASLGAAAEATLRASVILPPPPTAAEVVAIQSKWEAPKNSAVCYQISAQWYFTAEAASARAETADMDSLCAAWDDEPELCSDPAAREGLTGYTAGQLAATCTIVGTHSHRCVADPCSSLSADKCTLQDSQGQCSWWSGQSLGDYNQFLKSRGRAPMPSAGCYRNPCSMPAAGKPKDSCLLKGAPGVFECTFCQGAGDRLLLGRDVGCQMTVTETVAECDAEPNATASATRQARAQVA